MADPDSGLLVIDAGGGVALETDLPHHGAGVMRLLRDYRAGVIATCPSSRRRWLAP
jgi:hypothetical protein